MTLVVYVMGHDGNCMTYTLTSHLMSSFALHQVDEEPLVSTEVDGISSRPTLYYEIWTSAILHVLTDERRLDFRFL